MTDEWKAELAKFDEVLERVTKMDKSSSLNQSWEPDIANSISF